MKFSNLLLLAKRLRTYSVPFIYVDGIFCGIPDTNDDSESSGFSHIIQFPERFDNVDDIILIDPKEFYEKVNGFYTHNEELRKSKKIKPAQAGYEVFIEDHGNHYRFYMESTGIENSKTGMIKIPKFEKSNVSHYKILETCERYHGIMTDESLFTLYELDADKFTEINTGIFEYFEFEHDGNTLMVPITLQMIGHKKLDYLAVSFRTVKLEELFQFNIITSKDNIIETHSAFITNFTL